MGKTKKIDNADESKQVVSASARVQTAKSLQGKTPSRPKVLCGHTLKVRTGCGALYVTLNRLEGRFYELFIRGGKAGGCASSQCEAIGRLISLALRNGVSINEVRDQLKGICCQRPISAEGEEVLSCADAVARAIKMAEALRESESTD